MPFKFWHAHTTFLQANAIYFSYMWMPISVTGERPYACNYCGKSFTRSSYLHQHKRIHRDEDQEVFKSYDPHICDKCGQTFNRKADLKDHVLVHTNERPYQCEMCDKAFRRKRNLRQHEKLHTGERWFCTECDKSFLRSYDLIKHKNIHLGIRITYTCEICSKILTSRSGYNGHMKHHLSADWFFIRTTYISWSQLVRLNLMQTIFFRKCLLTTGCQQSFWSGDNRLSADQTVWWQPAKYFSNKLLRNWFSM